MRERVIAALTMFLILVPVTLPVPGLRELVIEARGGTDSDAHAFMSINMMAGMLAVPVVMRLLRRFPDVRLWLFGALAIDALAFVGMGMAQSLPALYVFRVLDGVVHLPAVTLLMVAANRMAGDRRGASLGVLAASLMIGVAVGSPLGGWLVARGPATVFFVGAAFLATGALLAASLGRIPAAETGRRPSRYQWNRANAQTWVPLAYGFMDRFAIGIFVSTFTLFLGEVHALSASERGILIALFMLPFALLCYPAGRLADRAGWFAPMLIGNILFGVVYASYGVVPRSLLPVAMVLSGVFSALMFTPNLVLIADLARRGGGEGLFGAFQIAGSLGFLTGPIVGGILVALTRGDDSAPAYRGIFAAVGVLEMLLAVATFSLLRGLARERRGASDVVAATPAGDFVA